MGETVGWSERACGVFLWFRCLVSQSGLSATQAPPPAHGTKRDRTPCSGPSMPYTHLPLFTINLLRVRLPPHALQSSVLLPLVIVSSSVPKRAAMLAPPQGSVDPPTAPTDPTDPLVLYSQSLRDYTLRLWMESRKQAEERVRSRTHKKHHGAVKAPLPTSGCQPGDGENIMNMPNSGSTLTSQGSSS
jgi:hypothetical protein